MPTNMQHKGYEYGDSNWTDKLTKYDGQEITYDAIGNPLTYRDSMTMTWKNGRQLATLQQGDNNISYEYDSNSVRISKTVNGEKYTYAYINGMLMYETRGESKFYYSYDANGTLYSVKYTLSDSSDLLTYYYTHNSRGDIVGIYNGAGQLRAHYEYDAWGNVISVTDENGSAITNANHIGNLNPFRYRGYYYDSETGLYYLMSRYYDPVTHRFINADDRVDNTSNIIGCNLFIYCNNNPIMNMDPDGHFWLAAICIAVATVVVAAICTSSNNRDSHQQNKRPYTGEPNSTYHCPNGDKRTFNDKGLPKQDYDHDDHGNPNEHPHDENGGHYHDWDWSSGRGVRGPAYVPTSTFDITPIAGTALSIVCLVGIAVVAIDNVSVIGIADDFLYIPLGAGLSEGFIMVMG